MESLGLGDIKNKITNAVNNTQAAIDTGTRRVKETWNTSPLGKTLSGGDTVIDNRGSKLHGPQQTAPKGSPAKPPSKMPKYHKGTDFVPKTGPAILKKGEAVLNNKDAAEHRAMKHGMEGAASELGGHEAKPKKEIKHIVTKKAKSGGYIHEHHHTHPEHHPMEEHVSKDQDGMMAHMMEHMGEANPGEAEADAGQSGVPAAGAAPAAGAPAGM